MVLFTCTTLSHFSVAEPVLLRHRLPRPEVGTVGSGRRKLFQTFIRCRIKEIGGFCNGVHLQGAAAFADKPAVLYFRFCQIQHNNTQAGGEVTIRALDTPGKPFCRRLCFRVSGRGCLNLIFAEHIDVAVAVGHYQFARRSIEGKGAHPRFAKAGHFAEALHFAAFHVTENRLNGVAQKTVFSDAATAMALPYGRCSRQAPMGGTLFCAVASTGTRTEKRQKRACSK
jgi:hypothetical protein